ncbi:pyrroloquinoline quinone biosynthesis protein PqqB [Sorangium sp. So ce134]
MRLCVLGSSAGGGLPQWNCACPNCVEARRGSARVRPRTQDALALGVSDGGWFLVNASPDVHRQIESFSPLHPRAGRASPIAGVILTNGDLDHTLGLFSLRENTPLAIYATEAVYRGLTEGNTIFRTLQRFPGQTTWRRLELEQPAELTGPDGAPTGVTVVPVALPGKVPKHLEGLAPPSPEDNIGLWVRDAASGRRAAIATAVGAAGGYVPRLDGVDVCFFDGTFWSSDELVRLGLGKARAEDMAHLPIGGDGGSLRLLAGVAARRKIYTHINNTNPILVEGSPERRAVEEAGWEVAADGLVIDL